MLTSKSLQMQKQVPPAFLYLVFAVLGKFSPGVSLALRQGFQITDEVFCLFKGGIKSTKEFWAISSLFRSVHSSWSRARIC